MKKILSLITVIALFVCVLASCSGGKTEGGEEGEKATVRVASLKGPTTMGLVKLLDDGEKGKTSYALESAIYGTADEVIGLIISGAVDVAAIPANVASVLYNKTEGQIMVAAINTLGVLYIVENGDTVKSVGDLRGRTIYSTGKGTTPEYVLNAVLKWNGLDPEKDLNIEYKSESTEIAALLTMSDKDAVAVLPQPYVAGVIEQNPSVSIALDLTKEWQAASGNMLVTGVVAVSRDFAQNNPDVLDAFLSDYQASAEYVNSNVSEAARLIERYGIVANAGIAEKALPYCNITFITGDDMHSNLSSYLEVLFEQNPASVGGKLPDEEFYFKK